MKIGTFSEDKGFKGGRVNSTKLSSVQARFCLLLGELLEYGELGVGGIAGNAPQVIEHEPPPVTILVLGQGFVSRCMGLGDINCLFYIIFGGDYCCPYHGTYI